MGKATIIEAQNSNTVYEQGKSKGTLGKLKGIFADYKHGTRNSDRLYTEELWDNRVFGSSDVMEALQTKTLFGELDHPEGDRCETLAKNAAITITKLEKRPDEGVIYGEAEILDTPTGRIVKALADSGAQLGISSRGMGEEIYQEGKNIIDPETYDFITFDVVVTPANTKARVSLTESKHLNKLTESVTREINESETQNQLNQIKSVLQNTNIENKNTLLKQVENKLQTLNKPVNNKLTEANKTIALNLLKKRFTEQATTLEQTIEASNQLAKENKQLIEEKQFLDESRTTIKSKLKEAKIQINTLNKNIEDMKTSNKKAISQNTQVLQKQLQIALQKTEMLESVNKELQKSNTNLTENNKKLDKQLNNIQEINKQLSNDLDYNSKLLIEMDNKNKSLQNKVKILQEQKQTTQNTNIKLTENKKLQEQKTKQLENKVKELEDEVNRFSKLSFNPVIKATNIVTENYENTEYTQDEIDLLNTLINK